MPDHQSPGDTFKTDQAEAAKEAETRDQQSWDTNIRNGQAQAIAHEAHAAQMATSAELQASLAKAVNIATLVFFLHGLKRLVTRR